MHDAKRRAYQEKAEAEYRVWSARIEELLGKAQARKAAGKIAYHESIEDLRRTRTSLRQQLEALTGASEDAWGELRQGFERTFRDAWVAFHSAIQNLGDDQAEDAPTIPPKPSGTEESHQIT